jgi:hypothetical protein
VSAWGDFHLKALGKLAAPDDLEHQVQASGFLPLDELRDPQRPIADLVSLHF